MAIRFDLFRISLLKKHNPTLFALSETREQFIRRVFSSRWNFSHYKNDFYYVPIPNKKETIIGKIGREVELEYNVSPSEGFHKQSMPAWRASTIVVDPTSHLDGQKLAMEQINTVGRSSSIINKMCTHINKTDNGLYEIEINPILTEGAFYDFASAQKTPISFLSITFTPPNGLWTSASSTKDEVKAVAEKTYATKVKTAISNPKGLNIDSEGVKEAISYAESGSGTIQARTTGGATFNSQSKQKIVTLAEDDRLSESDVEAIATSNSNIILGQAP
ncbi:MAG: hypothetical protein ABII76_11820 [Pseudomonadota bacterium]